MEKIWRSTNPFDPPTLAAMRALETRAFEISPDLGTVALMVASGKADREAGVDKAGGWAAIAKTCGYTLANSPLKQAYLDGWYGV